MKHIVLIAIAAVLAGTFQGNSPARDLTKVFAGRPTWQLEEIPAASLQKDDGYFVVNNGNDFAVDEAPGIMVILIDERLDVSDQDRTLPEIGALWAAAEERAP